MLLFYITQHYPTPLAFAHLQQTPSSPSPPNATCSGGFGFRCGLFRWGVVQVGGGGYVGSAGGGGGAWFFQAGVFRWGVVQLLGGGGGGGGGGCSGGGLVGRGEQRGKR